MAKAAEGWSFGQRRNQRLRCQTRSNRRLLSHQFDGRAGVALDQTSPRHGQPSLMLNLAQPKRRIHGPFLQISQKSLHNCRWPTSGGWLELVCLCEKRGPLRNMAVHCREGLCQIVRGLSLHRWGQMPPSFRLVYRRFSEWAKHRRIPI